jgi:hypothetical protein
MIQMQGPWCYIYGFSGLHFYSFAVKRSQMGNKKSSSENSFYRLKEYSRGAREILISRYLPGGEIITKIDL